MIYIYDDFDGSNLGNLLTSVLDQSFTESGYHSVPLSSPLSLTAGNDVIVVVKFTNSAYTYPVPSDPNGPSETGRTYMSPDGTNFSWTDLGTYAQEDVAIRLRTSSGPPPEEWYWKPGNWTDYALSGMPDFDQRQDNWTNPQGNWSYCGPVAVADSLWWFDSKNELPTSPPPPAISDNYGLVTNFSNPWDDHDARNVIPLVNNLSWLMDTDGQRTGMPHNGTNVYDMQWGIDKYLINHGYYGYYYERTVKSPDFYWIEEEIERCEDVVLLLGFWQEMGPGMWYRVGGHYVTCAGVSSNTMQLGLSDPCCDNAEAGGPGRVPVPHPYPHNSSVHNDTQYVSHDIYNVTPSSSPGGIWGLPDYGMGINFSDFQFQNCPPEFEYQQGLYDPGLPVYTEIEYAVTVSPKEDLNDMIDSHYVWEEGGPMAGTVNISVHVVNETLNNTIWDIEVLFWTEMMGTDWVYHRDFYEPLQYCQDYYFNVSSGVLPEIVVLHFSNETGGNIGFAFSNAITYNLTVVSNGCCPVDVDGLGTVPPGGNQTFYNLTKGTTVSLTANCDPCCVLNGWTVDGSPWLGNPINVAMNSDHTAVANCTWLTYNLTVISAGCCPIEVSGPIINDTIPAGGSATYPLVPCCNNVILNATPAGNCVFDNWTVDGIPVGGNPIVVHIDGDHTAVATCHEEWWYWKPGNWTDYALSGMPDFDQKQDNWTNPQGNWSYCGPVAVANSLWWFDSKNEPSPVPPPAINDNYGLVTNFSNPWDDHDARNVMPLVNNLSWLMDTDGQRTGMPHNGTNVYDMQWGIDKYLVNTGYYGYYYERTVKTPDFYWIEAEIERCEDVVLLLGFWQELGPGYWVRVGGHYVTCAGVNSNLSQLGISDPCCDNAEAGGPGRVPVPHPPYPHNSSVHNDTQYVSHDVYNVSTSPSPGGIYGLENYAYGLNVSDFQFQNCPPEFEPQQRMYEPGLPVYTEIEYAVTVSPKEDLNDVIDSHYVWEEGGPMAGTVNISVHVVNETLNNTIWDIEFLFWTEGNGTAWVYNETFNESLKFCQKYYFNISYPVEPEIVVLHFSNETHDNIGFAFSTPQAANATLIGHMTFSGTVAGRVMTVRFYDPANKTEMGWSPLYGTTDTSGNFTVDNVTPGTWDVLADNCSDLTEMSLGETFTAGNTFYVNFGSSREGDCNGDDYIDALDSSMLFTSWNTMLGDPGYNVCCDLNRDDWIDAMDWSAMCANWNQLGDLSGY